LTLTSGTILVMVMAFTLLLVADLSDVEVLGRSEDEVDCLEEGFAGPKVAEDRGKEGVETRSGDRLPAFATAILREWIRGFKRAEAATKKKLVANHLSVTGPLVL